MDNLFLGEKSECEKVLDDYLELKFSENENVRKRILDKTLSRDLLEEYAELQLVEGVIVNKKLLLIRDSGVSELESILDLDVFTKAVRTYNTVKIVI